MREQEFDQWIELARSEAITNEEIADLAERLAASGERLRFREKSADIASTGGPASLSTLWAPAVLVAAGYSVPKLGVPGRPAGGVDVLAQVPGYRVNLSGSEADAVVEACGYVHGLAGDRIAPADAAMFAYRKKAGAQHVPALAIASLLAKKLAMGVNVVGLEVRVARHGNFGANVTAARHNARRFCDVAHRLGLAALCFLTDGEQPQQPYIGRGEALLALTRLLDGEACSWLSDHTSACGGWASMLTGAPQPPHAESARAFKANLAAQGGSFEGMAQRAVAVAAAHRRKVVAANDGVISYDLGKLREALLCARNPDSLMNFDDSAGFVILSRPGAFVRAGENVVSIRCRDETASFLHGAVENAISLAKVGGQDRRAEACQPVEVISVRGR